MVALIVLRVRTFPHFLAGILPFLIMFLSRGFVSLWNLGGGYLIARAVLGLGVEERLIPQLPFKIRKLKTVSRRSSHIFTKEEIERLLDCAEPRTRMLLLIAFATGMRVGEIIHLQFCDIDAVQRKISVRAKGDWTPKTHHERDCYVPQSVVRKQIRFPLRDSTQPLCRSAWMSAKPFVFVPRPAYKVTIDALK